MKKLRLLSAFLALFTAIGFTGCSDEDPSMMEGGPGTGVNSGVFRVNYNNGIQFVADNAAAVATSGSISITGTIEETGEIITMSLTGNNLGTYTNIDASYVYDGAVYTNVNPSNGIKSGLIKITGINTANSTISGEFSFIGYPDNGDSPMPFFNGMFTNVSYTGALPEPVEPNPNPAPAQEYLKAKVNGTLTEFPVILDLTEDGKTIVSGTNTELATYLNLSLNLQDVAVGTFPLTSNSFDGFTADYIENVMDGFNSVEGEINITEYENGWVSGTFFFTGENNDGGQVEITEGQFNINLNP